MMIYVELNKKMSASKKTKPTPKIKKIKMKDRTQIYNPKINRYIKIDTETGKFMKQKKSEGKFKRVKTSRKKKKTKT